MTEYADLLKASGVEFGEVDRLSQRGDEPGCEGDFVPLPRRPVFLKGQAGELQDATVVAPLGTDRRLHPGENLFAAIRDD